MARVYCLWTLYVCFLLTQAQANVLFDEKPSFNLTLGGVDVENQEIGNSFSASFISENLRIPAEGRIVVFQFKIGSRQLNSSIFLQVWRYLEDDTYMLTRTKKLTELKIGLNEVVVNWLVPEGDMLGISCNGYCPVMRGPSDPSYKSKVSMTDYPIEYVKYYRKRFRDHDLMGKMSLLAVLEINGRREDFFTTLPITAASTEKPTTSSISSSSGVSTTQASSGTLPTLETPQGQVSESPWWQWLLIAAGIIIVLLVFALLIVAGVSWRKEKDGMKREMRELSRNNSRLSRQLTAANSQVNTLARNHPGTRAVDEMVVPNEHQSAFQGAQASTLPDSTVEVEFDNGVTNLQQWSPTMPPPPRSSPPTS
ncbi:uncharacterized protein [Watersipora subatra]|uniref:uncharacterized protein n=1 Tax=Watersipora subatra TaxID=2589382 RepID=UPI00355C71DA